jgi:hypothetical protein
MSAGSVQWDIGTLRWRCWPSDPLGSAVRLLDWLGPTAVVNRGSLLDTYAVAIESARISTMDHVLVLTCPFVKRMLRQVTPASAFMNSLTSTTQTSTPRFEINCAIRV